MPALEMSILLAEIEDSIRLAPARVSDPNAVAWIGRATSLLKRWDPDRSLIFDSYARGAFGISPIIAASDFTSILMVLHEARHDIRLNEVGPLSTTINHGAVLDYFEEIRKVLITARKEVFFVDPYLDAEFVSRYLPHIHAGASVRLLGKKAIAALTPAVGLAAEQFQLTIALRASPDLHDRFVFIDRARGFNSGPSFKDGARFAPAIFTEVTDALQSVLATYEQMWAAASIHC